MTSNFNKSLYGNDDISYLQAALEESSGRFRKGVADPRDFRKYFKPQNFKSTSGKFSYQQEVVFKRLRAGMGKKSLLNVMRYIARDFDYQKDKGVSSENIYDSNGNVLNPEEFEKKINTWSENFHSLNTEDITEETFKKIERLEAHVEYLRQKKEEHLTTPEENNFIKGYSKGNPGLFSVWAEGTKVKFKTGIDEEGNYYYRKGKISKIDGEKVTLSLYDSDTNKYRYQEYKKSHLVPYEIAGGLEVYSTSRKTKDHHKSFDDPNYRVDVLDAKIAASKIKNDFDHMIFSPGGKFSGRKEDRVMEATQAFLDKSFKKRGYDYMVAMHQDTDNTHFHVIVNRRNMIDKNLQYGSSKIETQNIRSEYAAMLDFHGINRSVTLKKQRKDAYHILRERLEKGEAKANQYTDKYKDNSSMAANPILDAYNVHKYLTELEKNIDKGFGKKMSLIEKKVLKDNLKKSHDHVFSFTKENFDTFKETLSNNLHNSSKDAQAFWEREIDLQKIVEFSKEENKKRFSKSIETQKEEQQKIMNTYTLLHHYREPDNKEREKFILAYQSTALELIQGHEDSISSAEKAIGKTGEKRFENIKEAGKFLDDAFKVSKSLSDAERLTARMDEIEDAKKKGKGKGI